jgi:hypothetical protein
MSLSCLIINQKGDPDVSGSPWFFIYKFSLWFM